MTYEDNTQELDQISVEEKIELRNQYQKEIEVAKKDLAMGEALQRLQANKDWITLIQNHYLTEYGHNQIYFYGHVGMNKEQIENEMKGISGLFRYTKVIETKAKDAKARLVDMQLQLNELE
jgi:hypothetical protein